MVDNKVSCDLKDSGSDTFTRSINFIKRLKIRPKSFYAHIHRADILILGKQLIQPQSKVTRAAIFVYIQLVHAVAKS